jgi:hypothetical protein
MKIAIISTCWLDNDDYLQKTVKFIKYYTQPAIMTDLGITPKDIWFVDNASSQEAHDKLRAAIPDLYDAISFKRYTKHYTRKSHLEYPYCWRALYFARELFDEHGYDKVISTNNDSYIISPKFAKSIKYFETGYLVPHCTKHNFPECEIQIITKDCKEYWEMTGKSYLEYNGRHMEWCIRPTVIDRSLVGDRHSEYPGVTEVPKGCDYSVQVPLNMEVIYDT